MENVYIVFAMRPEEADEFETMVTRFGGEIYTLDELCEAVESELDRRTTEDGEPGTPTHA